MHIFLDESGSFVTGPQQGSWCVVAAYIVPEATLEAAEEAIIWFRIDAGNPLGGELKRKDASEDSYFRLLDRLSRLDGIAVAIATDTYLHGNVSNHQEDQAARILANEPRMEYEAGKEMVRRLAESVRALAPQNYVEMICRAQLAWDVVKTSTLYYSQRVPETLGAFSWRFDQKNLSRNRFESTFANVAPGFMQSISVRDPMVQLVEGDYSAFERFTWDREYPDWLPPQKGNAPQLDAGRIWREDLDFVDSRYTIGVQIADLIASGVFGCLRGRFKDNNRAAYLLGKLMVDDHTDRHPLRLVHLGEQEAPLLDGGTSHRMRIMHRTARAMFDPAPG